MIGPDEEPFPEPLIEERILAGQMHVMAEILGDETLLIMVEEVERALEEGRLETAMSINRQCLEYNRRLAEQIRSMKDALPE